MIAPLTGKKVRIAIAIEVCGSDHILMLPKKAVAPEFDG
jgi:hypothetical protein